MNLSTIKSHMTSFNFMVLLCSVFVLTLASCKPKSSSVASNYAEQDEDAFLKRSIFDYISDDEDDIVVKSADGSILVQPLFYENSQIQLLLPPDLVAEGSNGGLISEQVVYRNEDNFTELFESKMDSTKAYGLNEVVIEAKSRFSPERDGKINVDFLVYIPKELISKNWRIKIIPKLETNDTILSLDPVIVKGDLFSMKQLNDYSKYRDFEMSIVDSAEYNAFFLDLDGVASDIKNRQNFFYKDYEKKWSRIRDYKEWLDFETNFRAEKLAVVRGELKTKEIQYRRQAMQETQQKYAMGVDTVGTTAKYLALFNTENAQLKEKLKEVENAELSVPEEFKEIHEAQMSLNNVKHQRVTSKDTLSIVEMRYHYDEIEFNEMKKSYKDKMFKQLVPFPAEEEFRIDTTLIDRADFKFLYSQTYKVTPGMTSIKIYAEGNVQAIDQSVFNLDLTDTLKYFVSSISQLVDTSLVSKETKVIRNALHRETIYPKYKTGTAIFNLTQGDNKAQLQKLLDSYEKLQSSSIYAVDSILLQGYTDLSGSYNKNADLSMKRTVNFKNYLLRNTPIAKALNNKQIVTSYKGEDWNGLVSAIRKNTDILHKDAILTMLSSADDPDEMEKDLQAIYPSDFAIIEKEIYPELNKVVVQFNIHRKDMAEDELERLEYAPAEYVKGVRLYQEGKYQEALEILANYPDYNTALCLLTLGHNGPAYELLVKLPQTGNTEYLAAMAAWRIGQEDVAAKHLEKAIELDEYKSYRIPLDADMIDLVNKKSLQHLVK